MRGKLISVSRERQVGTCAQGSWLGRMLGGYGGAATFLLVWQERWSWCLEKGTVQGVNRMSFSNYVEFLLNFYDTFLHARVKTMGASLYIYI